VEQLSRPIGLCCTYCIYTVVFCLSILLSTLVLVKLGPPKFSIENFGTVGILQAGCASCCLTYLPKTQVNSNLFMSKSSDCRMIIMLFHAVLTILIVCDFSCCMCRVKSVTTLCFRLKKQPFSFSCVALEISTELYWSLLLGGHCLINHNSDVRQWCHCYHFLCLVFNPLKLFLYQETSEEHGLFHNFLFILRAFNWILIFDGKSHCCNGTFTNILFHRC